MDLSLGFHRCLRSGLRETRGQLLTASASSCSHQNQPFFGHSCPFMGGYACQRQASSKPKLSPRKSGRTGEPLGRSTPWSRASAVSPGCMAASRKAPCVTLLSQTQTVLPGTPLSCAEFQATGLWTRPAHTALLPWPATLPAWPQGGCPPICPALPASPHLPLFYSSSPTPEEFIHSPSMYLWRTHCGPVLLQL